MGRGSLRARLAAASALAVLLVSAVFGVVQFRFFSQSALNRVDEDLDRALSTVQQFASLAGSLGIPGELSRRLVETALADKPEIETWCVGPGCDESVPAPPDGFSQLGASGSELVYNRDWLGRPYRIMARRADSFVILAGQPIDGVLASQRQIMWFLVAQAVLMATVAGGLGYLVTRQAMRPVRRLAGTAQAIAETGDLKKRVREGAADRDLSNLASTFNDMLDRIEVVYQRLADSLEAEKRLVADASHELRTPLTTIQGNVDYLRRRGADAEAIDDIQASTDRLTTLVTHLTELAREDAGVHETFVAVDFDEMVRDICAEPAFGGVDLRLDLDENLWVEGSETSLSAVVRNLVGNAVKYGAGEVSVTARAEDGNAVLEVDDNGPGVDPDDIELVFERFWRSGDTKGREGSGLGLSIVRATVDAHGGSVVALPGPGGRFRVTLPLCSPRHTAGAELDEGEDAAEPTGDGDRPVASRTPAESPQR
ncbi:MAG: HAMP domain-containing histidine kinase [Acidimicrobiia bacterium]|nr:HAMP domain-containing histidine kinase [Acidimicrobiia bacterium]